MSDLKMTIMCQTVRISKYKAAAVGLRLLKEHLTIITNPNFLVRFFFIKEENDIYDVLKNPEKYTIRNCKLDNLKIIRDENVVLFNFKEENDEVLTPVSEIQSLVKKGINRSYYSIELKNENKPSVISLGQFFNGFHYEKDRLTISILA